MVALNGKIWVTLFFLFGSKAYGIFALLFGFTFHLQFSRRATQGVDFGPVFFMENGDSFWIRMDQFNFISRRSASAICSIGTQPLFCAKIWKQGTAHSGLFVPATTARDLSVFCSLSLTPIIRKSTCNVGALWGTTFNYIKEGTLLALVVNSWTGVKATFFWSLENGRIEQTIGLFMLGYYIGRNDWFSSSKKSFVRWAKILGICFVLFGILLSFEMTLLGSLNEQYQGFLKTLTNAWKNFFQIAVMVSLFCVLSNLKWFQWFTKPLRSYGRMSLSNYMLQSIFGGLIFYPYGLGLAEKLNTTYSVLLGFGLFLVYLAFCNAWFLVFKFKQGPLEMIWHYLTWLPLKRRSVGPNVK